MNGGGGGTGTHVMPNAGQKKNYGESYGNLRSKVTSLIVYCRIILF